MLEEKFTSCAGIRASTTTDRLFEWAASGNAKSDNEEYVYNGDVEYNDEQEDEGDNNVIEFESDNSVGSKHCT